MGELKNIGLVRCHYDSPEVMVLDIEVQEMLCQSGSIISDLTLREDDSSNWG